MAVASALGQDPAEAIRLAGFWKEVKQVADEPAWIFRARGGVENYQGQWKKSADSFALAGRYAKDPIQKLTFQIGRIDALARSGKVAQAIAIGKPLAQKLAEAGEAFQSARVHLSIANALLWQERFADARRFLTLAEPALAAEPGTMEYAMLTLSMSTTHLHAGSLAECRDYATRSRDALEELGLSRYADLATINLAHVALFQGRPDQALDQLLELRSRQEGEDTVDAARLNEFLGDAYLRLNLWPEARDSYASAMEMGALLPALNVADCVFGIGQALASEGDHAGARAQMRSARGRFERLESAPWAALCNSAIARTYLDDGRTKEAAIAAHEAYVTAKAAKSPYAWLQSALVYAECEVRQGNRPTLAITESRELVRRHGYVSEGWRVEYLLAQLATDLAKLNHFRKMCRMILEGRMLTTSVAARSSFLRDKQTALREYLDELVEVPTARRINEALDVIQQSRAVALLDEIASAGSGVSGDALSKMDALRAELNSVETADASAEGSKRKRASQSQLASLQRRWSEATRQVFSELAVAAPRQTSRECAVLVETERNVLVMQNGTAVRLPVTPEELRSRMRWLEFELMAPLAEPDIAHSSATKELKDLADLLILPWITERPGNIVVSPDGHLWRIPWQAVAMSAGFDGEIALAMHPSCRVAEGARLGNSPRVAIWASGDASLPYIEQEVSRLMKVFPQAQLCETAQDVRNSMRDKTWDLIHVAAHASHCNSNPMFSFFEIGGERVYATEIAQGDFTVGISVLSACETGSLSYDRKDEPDGLARAFLARKASAVVGSAWRLDDEAASVMMNNFYGALNGGEPIVNAMSASRKAARSQWEHPYYWAPLVLFGGYA